MYVLHLQSHPAFTHVCCIRLYPQRYETAGLNQIKHPTGDDNFALSPRHISLAHALSQFSSSPDPRIPNHSVNNTAPPEVMSPIPSVWVRSPHTLIRSESAGVGETGISAPQDRSESFSRSGHFFFVDRLPFPAQSTFIFLIGLEARVG